MHRKKGVGVDEGSALRQRFGRRQPRERFAAVVGASGFLL